MLRGIDFKSRTLFGTHRNLKCQVTDMSHSIRRAQKTHMSVKVDYESHSLFGTHRKRTCQVRLPQVSYSIEHAQKVHMLSKIDLKSRTLFGLGTD